MLSSPVMPVSPLPYKQSWLFPTFWISLTSFCHLECHSPFHECNSYTPIKAQLPNLLHEPFPAPQAFICLPLLQHFHSVLSNLSLYYTIVFHDSLIVLVLLVLFHEPERSPEGQEAWHGRFPYTPQCFQHGAGTKLYLETLVWLMIRHLPNLAKCGPQRFCYKTLGVVLLGFQLLISQQQLPHTDWLACLVPPDGQRFHLGYLGTRDRDELCSLFTLRHPRTT